jgi:hypothetical protein
MAMTSRSSPADPDAALADGLSAISLRIGARTPGLLCPSRMRIAFAVDSWEMDPS